MRACTRLVAAVHVCDVSRLRNILDRMRQLMLCSRAWTSVGMASYSDETRERPVPSRSLRHTSCALTARLFRLMVDRVTNPCQTVDLYTSAATWSWDAGLTFSDPRGPFSHGAGGRGHLDKSTSDTYGATRQTCTYVKVQSRRPGGLRKRCHVHTINVRQNDHLHKPSL